MSQTFKQFLESDSLGMLPYELFFRKEVRLSHEDAKRAVEWAVMAGQLDAPTFEGDAWDHLVDWAIAEYEKENPGKDFYILAGKISMNLAVKSMIAKIMRERYKLELMHAPINEDALENLPFELAIRKELKASEEQANELVLWLANEKDWFDLDFDARGAVLNRWDHKEVQRVKHPGMSYSDYVMDKLADLLRDKYNLDARELL